jgi:kinesin family protein 5
VQLKRLKLRKNNWDCETYQFDEILTETASQKRVYEVVAKPVVEVFIRPSYSICLPH